MKTNFSLKSLGNKTPYVFNYDFNLLETFENPHQDRDYFVQFHCPEFTTLCPITGQPDFATISISYIPQAQMVESKSLKLYLFSFRNECGFHEDCVNRVLKDLIKLLEPKYLEVLGDFAPRGGISINPYTNYGIPNTKYEEMANFRLLHHNLAK